MNWIWNLTAVLVTVMGAAFMTAVMRRIDRKQDSLKVETVAQIRRDRDAYCFVFNFILFSLFAWGEKLGKLISLYGPYVMVTIVFALVMLWHGMRVILYLWERRHPWRTTTEIVE